MKFSPCISGKCTEEGNHCEGCGRTHQEIAETKRIIKELVTFAQNQQYENVDDFANFIGETILHKLQPQ